MTAAPLPAGHSPHHWALALLMARQTRRPRLPTLITAGVPAAAGPRARRARSPRAGAPCPTRSRGCHPRGGTGPAKARSRSLRSPVAGPGSPTTRPPDGGFVHGAEDGGRAPGHARRGQDQPAPRGDRAPPGRAPRRRPTRPGMGPTAAAAPRPGRQNGAAMRAARRSATARGADGSAAHGPQCRRRPVEAPGGSRTPLARGTRPTLPVARATIAQGASGGPLQPRPLPTAQGSLARGLARDGHRPRHGSCDPCPGDRTPSVGRDTAMSESELIEALSRAVETRITAEHVRRLADLIRADADHRLSRLRQGWYTPDHGTSLARLSAFEASRHGPGAASARGRAP